MAKNEKDGKLVSLSGALIWEHGEEKPWEAARGESCLVEITEHIEQHLGPIAMVFHEVVSDTVHIDVHHVEPTEDAPFHTLVTSGMSSLPMNAPSPELAFMELMVCLPPEWRVRHEEWNDEAWYWPIRRLKELARFPHKYDTWLGYGHTVPNGDPPEPYAANTKLNCIAILPQIAWPSEFDELVVDGEKTIRFMYTMPIYQEEMDLKLRCGIEALLDRFAEHETRSVLDPIRPNVAL